MADYGHSPPPEASGDVDDYTNVQVSIDTDYACTIFSSCKGTSFISAAAISSSVAFLDFLGSNGAMYSRSWINFTTDWEGETTSYLNSSAVPCQYPVDSSGVLNSYEDITNSTCAYCQKICGPPVVDDTIGFLDGFSWKIVGYSYLGFICFTILWQVLTHCHMKKKKLEKARQAALANQTGTTAAETSNHSQVDSRIYKQGRPVNMTASDQSSLDMNRKTDVDMGQD